jgi:hypothetical protein
MISLVLTGTVLCLPALAQAGEPASKTAQGTSSSSLANLREAGTEGQTWSAEKSAFIVDTRVNLVMKAPVSVLMHFVGVAIHKRAIKGHKLFIERYIQGENKKSWYAMAGAGGHAVALKPGTPIESDGLRLQRRAKIGVAQLGMARDIGSGRVTLGYLRNNTSRDALIPYSTRKERQNMAALTLTIKR